MVRKFKSNVFFYLFMIDWGYILFKFRYLVSGIGMWSIVYSFYFIGLLWIRVKVIILGCMGIECMRI